MTASPLTFVPIDRPLVIDAIRCRLDQDVNYCTRRGQATVAIPVREMELIVAILDAARAVVREYAPTDLEKSRGAGTGVGMRAAEDRLITTVKRDLRPDRWEH